MDSHRMSPISDPSDVGVARRLAVAIAGKVGFDASNSGRVALVVTEASTNILKHATKGQILLKPINDVPSGYGVEVIALDRGPGMADVRRCFEDGYSSAGSPGTGLGAISRLASNIEVFSTPGLGTALLARILVSGERSGIPSPFRVGAVRVPAPHEVVCGDDWSFIPSPQGARLFVADGLGHGPEAAKAAAEAVRVFKERSGLPLAPLLTEVHRALQSTRGAAASCAEIDTASNVVLFAGVGNVVGMIAEPGNSRSIATQNGTLGGQVGQIRPVSMPFQPGGCLVVHTDGLTSHASTQGYPGLLARDPTLIAAVLYRDFVRGRDDATVVVCHLPRASQ